MIGAKLLVKTLERSGVRWAFGVPGAKIDAFFDALSDSSINTVVCRHEQDAAFMAEAVGRLTGRPGVVAVTSGPGTSNLATGLLTANTEGDPVIAICGDVPRNMQFKRTHQAFDSLSFLKSVSKYAEKVAEPEQIQEAVSNALRKSLEYPKGSAAVAVCQDALLEEAPDALFPKFPPPVAGAPEETLQAMAGEIMQARLPVFFVGQRGGEKAAVRALRSLLEEAPIPVVETFQGNGAICKDLESLYMGRVGIFGNQPGDELLKDSDCVVAVGYDPVEYDSKIWNGRRKGRLLHIDWLASDLDKDYSPDLEAVGDISKSLESLSKKLRGFKLPPEAEARRAEAESRLLEKPRVAKTGKVSPIDAVEAIRKACPEEATVISDVGSVYIYMARYFRSYLPGHLLFSNGQQTLGVALPWAIAARLSGRERVVSVSGDGGFLFSAMEIETAMRMGMGFVHVIFNDGSYDMVGFQERMKYGRDSGVKLGPIEIPDFARSFGALGLKARSAGELELFIRQNLHSERPVIIDVPIEYGDNVSVLAK